MKFIEINGVVDYKGNDSPQIAVGRAVKEYNDSNGEVNILIIDEEEYAETIKHALNISDKTEIEENNIYRGLSKFDIIWKPSKESYNTLKSRYSRVFIVFDR